MGVSGNHTYITLTSQEGLAGIISLKDGEDAVILQLHLLGQEVAVVRGCMNISSPHAHHKEMAKRHGTAHKWATKRS